MQIKALLPFTLRDSDTGELTSYACGQIANVDSTLGANLVEDGLAVENDPVVPQGSVSITENGSVDVEEYATAVVNVSASAIVGSAVVG